MGWIAISDTEEHRFSADGLCRGAVASERVGEVQIDRPMPEGSLMVETRLSPEGRPQTLLAFERLHPRPYKLTLQALPGGGLVLVIADGADVFHTALHHDSQDRADILRITYSWVSSFGGEGPAYRGRLSIERPEYDSVSSVDLKSARPLMLEDVQSMATDPRRRLLDGDVQFFAVSDRVEPVGPMPCLAGNVPILVDGGYTLAGNVRRGDMVETLESGLVPVLQTVKRTVPACGSFRPVRLRAPYFGLVSDIIVAPDQRLVVGGSEVEYTFGREAVLVPARHLVNGISAIELTGAVTMSYTQLILPRHESVIAAGCPLESLYLGRLRRKPAPLAASLLAGEDRRMLPEHALSAYLMIKPFEAITLMQSRAA